MQFKQAGGKEKPTVILLHGGGLSWRSFERVIDTQERLPCRNPHPRRPRRGCFRTVYQHEAAAEKLIAHIHTVYGGHVFALGGLSIGAQIAVETLSRRPEIASHAILESALVVAHKKHTPFLQRPCTSCATA